MRLPRFRVRTLMVAVAVVAVAASLWHRSERFRRLADCHQEANVWIIFDWEAAGEVRTPLKFVRPPLSEARAQWHDALRLKYERAARRPWLPVAPDPPPPD